MAANTGGVTPSVGEAEVLIPHHFLEGIMAKKVSCQLSHFRCGSFSSG